MKKTRVLYVSQEINPFLPKDEVSEISRNLPQQIQEKGKEIRVFMPRFGSINERRHQLHEVIRLSGMNLVINDRDYPLIIKVASIPTARMQVYFIDNEDFFHRKAVLRERSGKYFKDNDERSMFFGRGVLETVKKLGWAPDIIHVHGWFAGLLPLYVKKFYNDDPHFQDSKVIYSAYDNGFEGKLDPKVVDKLAHDGIDKKDVELLGDPHFVNLSKTAFQYSDGIIQGSQTIDEELSRELDKTKKPTLGYQDPEAYVKAYDEFYDSVLEKDPMLVNS